MCRVYGINRQLETSIRMRETTSWCVNRTIYRERERETNDDTGGEYGITEDVESEKGSDLLSELQMANETSLTVMFLVSVCSSLFFLTEFLYYNKPSKPQ